MTGLYWLDLHDEAEALSWAERYGRPLHAVPMEAVRKAVPSLGEGYERAVYMEAWPTFAIRDCCRRCARRWQGCQRDGRRALPGRGLPAGWLAGRGREDGAGRYACRAGRGGGGCTGAQLLATLGLQIPVKPMKGQMILFKCAEDFLPSMVLAKRRYAIPRRDGHIWSAARWKMSVSTRRPPRMRCKACERPQSIAARARRRASGQALGRSASGSPDGVPYIGQVSGFDGLWLNCGHFRNGLVLAPASCQLLADLMLGREPIVDPAPYAPTGRIV